MGCDQGFAIWGPFPPGSQFCGKVDAEGDDFFVNIEISTDTGSATMLGTSALMQGVCIPLANEGQGALATVRIGAETATVLLRMFVRDSSGTVLFECTTQHSTPKTTSNIIITLVPAT